MWTIQNQILHDRYLFPIFDYEEDDFPFTIGKRQYQIKYCYILKYFGRFFLQ